VRPKLFGAWEMNWLAFNTANDFALPNSKGGKLTFFMYPQAEPRRGGWTASTRTTSSTR